MSQNSSGSMPGWLALLILGGTIFVSVQKSTIFRSSAEKTVTGTILLDPQVRGETTKNFLYITDSDEVQTEAIIADHFQWGITNSATLRGYAKRFSGTGAICTVVVKGERDSFWSVLPWTESIDCTPAAPLQQ